MIGVILSCDVYASRCYNTGPHKLSKYIKLGNDKDKDIDIVLTECIADNRKCDAETISIYADSILHEPTNEISLHYNSVNINYKYFSKGPVTYQVI